MKAIKDKIGVVGKVFSLILRYSPTYFLFFVPQVIVSSVLPLLYVYVPKLIIEALCDGRAYGEIAVIISLFCAAVLSLRLLGGYLDKKLDACAERFSFELSSSIGRLAMNLSFCEIESTNQKDNIRLAGNAEQTVKLCEIIRKLIQNIITVIGYIVIVAGVNVSFLVVVFALFSVKVFFTVLNYKADIKLRFAIAQNDRTGNYLNHLCYFDQGGAKEIRTHNIQAWFLGKVRAYRGRMVSMQLRDYRRRLLFDSIHAVLFAVSAFYILRSLSAAYLGGLISIADFTLSFSAVTAMNASLGTIAELTAQYNQQLHNVADFGKLETLSQKSNPPHSALSESCLPTVVSEICFEHVWFAYPQCEDYVLRDVNIRIVNREKLVIVGYNGAGKSTFIKLLCKFYHPSKGRITLNGHDIWEIPDEEYRRMIGAVFQDFATFAFTVSENITMNETAPENGRLEDVLSETGLSHFVHGLPNDVNTYLSKKYDADGIELSGGQSQKIALARALYKDAPLLLLDEPTASLDLEAEKELYEDFMRAVSDKTAVMISHRLAASQIADHIAVFCNGTIAEYGTHRELIARRGVYADMFAKQSAPYAESRI